MKIHKLRFKNLNSFGNNWAEIDFNAKANTRVIGIVGGIGQGKSSIFDAIFFTLYGAPFRKVTKGSIINRTNNGGLESELYFNNNGSEWVIRRGMKPHFVEIIKDGEFLPLDSHVLVTQKFIEKQVIGLNQKIFMQMFMLSMGNFKSFFTLTIWERRQIFEEIVRISVLSEMLVKIKAKEKVFEQKIAMTEVEIRVIQEKITSFEIQIQKINQLSIEKLDTLEIEKNSNTLEKVNIEKELKLLDLEEKKKKKNEYVEEYNKIKWMIESLDKKLEENLDTIDFYENNDICPECKQNIDIQLKNKKLLESKESKDKFEKELKEYFEKATTDLEPKIEGIEKDIKEGKKIKAKLETFETTLKVIDEKIADFSNNKNSNEQIKESITLEIENTKKDKSDKEQKKVDLLEQISVNNVFKFILSDDGFKKYVYQYFIPILNYYMNENLSHFNFNRNFKLDGNLQETFWQFEGENIPFETFSNGEKQIIEMSFVFALQRFLQKVYDFKLNLTFADELFDSSLDFDTIELIINFLHQEFSSKVVIISHNAELKSFFDELFFVRKTNGFSEIIKEI